MKTRNRSCGAPTADAGRQSHSASNPRSARSARTAPSARSTGPSWWEDRKPVSISDTYQPIDVADASTATDLEETIADRLPAPAHAEWLRTTPGDLVKTVHQRFFAADRRLIMSSDLSYPQGRFAAFLFRMALRPQAGNPNAYGPAR